MTSELKEYIIGWILLIIIGMIVLLGHKMNNSEQNRNEHCKPCQVVVHCMCGCSLCKSARARARELDKAAEKKS